ncbi:MAG: hypothetical protein EXR73_14510 [Myxococcales bacterium]|nr:hypothetical protein [Myxococcales bacterium]
MEHEKLCTECGRTAARLRRSRCDACYMRLYRGGEIPAGACCGGCGEPRRVVLVFADVGEGEVVLCGNCQVVLARTRPRAASLVILQQRIVRDRRAGMLRRADGKRTGDYIPAPQLLDVSID